MYKETMIPVGSEYDQSSSYPITGLDAIGIEVINLDVNNSMQVTLTYEDATNYDFTVPPAATYTQRTKQYDSLDVTTSSTSFYIHTLGAL